MMRLFVALDLPDELRERLEALQGGLHGAFWTDPDDFHLTLRFIGEVAAFQAEEIDTALSALRARGFCLSFSGVGVFARAGRPPSLWAGIERSPGLEHLQSKVEVALQRIGLPPERRRFTPHVTLGRAGGASSDKLAAWVAAHNLFRAGTVPVEHFTLFSSRLGKDRSIYTPEVDYALA